jgi:hypothetical protein
VGGAGNSFHLDGLATDFTSGKYGTPYAVAKAIAASGIIFDQLIHEKKGGHNWVHIGSPREGIAPRMQVLTITDAGTRVGLFKL